MNKNETIADIVAEMRIFKCHNLETGKPETCSAIANYLANRIEAAWKQEANHIERLVRDAIIDYQEMYVHAPNDDAERELVERAERGNAWLVAHGYEPEPVNFGKEEISCL